MKKVLLIFIFLLFTIITGGSIGVLAGFSLAEVTLTILSIATSIIPLVLGVINYKEGTPPLTDGKRALHSVFAGLLIFFIVIGVFVGIYFRTNDYFGFEEASLRKQIKNDLSQEQYYRDLRRVYSEWNKSDFIPREPESNMSTGEQTTEKSKKPSKEVVLPYSAMVREIVLSPGLDKDKVRRIEKITADRGGRFKSETILRNDGTSLQDEIRAILNSGFPDSTKIAKIKKYVSE